MPIPTQATLTLRTWVDEIGESRYPMTHEGDGIFTVELECTEPCLIWYSFICNIEGQPEVRLGAPQGRTGGEGVTYDYAEVPSFQVTVYKHRESSSRRGTSAVWSTRSSPIAMPATSTGASARWPKSKNRVRAFSAAWSRTGTSRPCTSAPRTAPSRPGTSTAARSRVSRNDLPRIAELGFTAIYLNPIFEAASNHRYDTADYTKIDPILGTEQDFTELCEAAEKLGISIILDGVFNHTGDDSIYFNRYGNYPGVGAWQSEDSPWRDAFYFHEDGSYDCWWGVGNMPAINESSELVRERLLGKDGVIRKWLRAGAHGWRLDVADELSDDFLTEIKKAVLAEKPDALLLGEVWEDASNKISYGHLRRYLQGSELDSAMDYPFRDMVIGFLMGYKNAYQAAEDIETLRENYPREALACALNLLSSHDRPRIISVLGGGPDESQLPESERSKWRLDENCDGPGQEPLLARHAHADDLPGRAFDLLRRRIRPGGPYRPGQPPHACRPRTSLHDFDTLAIVKNASAVRRALPFMVDGEIKSFALNDDVLGLHPHGQRR